MRLRSLLYVPGDNRRFIDKAHTRGADAIIIDLEDSVRSEDKDAARDGLAETIASAGRNGAKLFVRVNSELDVALMDAQAARKAGAFGIYVSKANPEKVQALEEFLPMVALIESPKALVDAEIMARNPGVMALSLGGEDFATEIGAQPSPEVLRVPRLLIHYAAKAHDKLSFGLFQSTADYADLDALAASAEEAAQHGFDGASCVHPDAVPILNAAFGAGEAETEWAQNVLDEAAKTGAGAFSLNDKMVDAPIIARARKILGRD